MRPRAGAAQARRVSSGRATHAPSENARMNSLEGAARWRVPKGPGRADLGPAQGRTWASSMLVGLAVHCLSPIGLTGHVPTGNLRAVVWEPCFPYHRHPLSQRKIPLEL